MPDDRVPVFTADVRGGGGGGGVEVGGQEVGGGAG